MLCKRCKKVEAVKDKKHCVKCAEYMSAYMKKRRLALKEALSSPLGVIVSLPPVISRKKETVSDKFDRELISEFLPKKISPEGLRFFYHYLTGVTFRHNVLQNKEEIKQILEELILILNLK